MKNQILLLDDVYGLGRKGEIVSAKPGYIRNFLIPSKKGVAAEKHLVRLQEKLKKERAEQSVSDKKEAEGLAKELIGKTLSAVVKIDAGGHMYGSIGAQEVVNLLKEQLNVALEKRSVVLPKGIKKLGSYEVELKLKENVPATIALEIKAEEKAAE
ncbi:MAG: 50S ribosomal protein L9 [Simkaniaceae bacterium]|nr:50S ribosomal protein L9 [Candidatus Sacchlamyda saccharinae]